MYVAGPGEDSAIGGSVSLADDVDDVVGSLVVDDEA